jgi:hypothetical protein
LVYGDYYGSFPLFPKNLGKGSAGASGHPPVYQADVIPGLVGAEFLKIDPPTAHLRQVQTGNTGDRAGVREILEGPGGVALDEKLLQRDDSTLTLVASVLRVDGWPS